MQHVTEREVERSRAYCFSGMDVISTPVTGFYTRKSTRAAAYT